MQKKYETISKARILWEPRELSRNLWSRGVCGRQEAGEVGHDRFLDRLVGVPRWAAEYCGSGYDT